MIDDLLFNRDAGSGASMRRSFFLVSFVLAGRALLKQGNRRYEAGDRSFFAQE